MSMNISGLGNTYNGINTNSKQYKALKEKGWLSGIMQNEAMMSSEERMIYETFGGRDTIINNLMKQFDSDGDLLNANGVGEWMLPEKVHHGSSSRVYPRNIVKRCLIM